MQLYEFQKTLLTYLQKPAVKSIETEQGHVHGSLTIKELDILDYFQ